MLTIFGTIFSAISGQIGTLFSFIIGNETARIVALVLLGLVGLWYVNRTLTNNAYENGKVAGQQAAVVQLQEAQEKVWKQDQDTLNAQAKTIADLRKQVDDALAAVQAKHAVDAPVHAQTIKQTEATVAKTLETVQEAPKQDDGLPSKQVLMDAASNYYAAYQSDEKEIQYLQSQYDETVGLQNKSIAERGQEIDNLNAKLELVTKERDSYKAGFKIATKKTGGFWHGVKKVFTLGIAR